MVSHHSPQRLSAAKHLAIDIITILWFALAPAVISLGAVASGVSLGLAVAHALLTAIVVAPPRRLRALIPTLHSRTELAVGGRAPTTVR
jgi:hypothetical protein